MLCIDVEICCIAVKEDANDLERRNMRAQEEGAK